MKWMKSNYASVPVTRSLARARPGCRGEGGKGLNPSIRRMYPVICGQHKAYLLKQLTDFGEDNRVSSPNIIMNRIVISPGDSDLEALAEYISVQ